MSTLNLMSISKPAVATSFDGSMMGIINLQTFMASNGFRINSMAMGTVSTTEAGEMVFQVNMTYTKTRAQDQAPFPTLAVTVNKGYVVVDQGAHQVRALSEEQLEQDYTSE